MRGVKPGLTLFAAALVLVAAACSPSSDSSSPPPSSAETSAAPPPTPASQEQPAERGTAETDFSTAAGNLEDIAPGAGVPMAPSSTAPGDVPPPGYGSSGTMPPAAAADPPAASVRPPPKNGHSGSKVLSYFQQGRTRIDTTRAFGFVLMPKVAVSDEEKRVQKAFCLTVLASMDFMTPGAVAASAPAEVLATFWPVVGSRESFEIKDAFTTRNCDDLIAWYDHKLARTLAAKAGVTELSGPLLITWPSTGADGDVARDPLIVDFSRANEERAKKALQYWFRQLKSRPELWTNRIREGTIRAELADAVNDTAGVMLSVLAGKWDSLTVVASAP